jgi:hypothetical protein
MTRQERMAIRRARKKEAKLTENLTPTEMDSEVENEPSGEVDPVDMLRDEPTGKADMDEMLSEILVATTAVQTVLERIEKMYAMELKAKYGWEFRHG